jgi:hypothetical protein
MYLYDILYIKAIQRTKIEKIKREESKHALCSTIIMKNNRFIKNDIIALRLLLHRISIILYEMNAEFMFGCYLEQKLIS